MMKNIKFIIGILLVICISIINIHITLYTVSNGYNPVTLVTMLSKGDVIPPFLTGYSVQFLVTLLAAYFILKFRHKNIWLIAYFIGVFAAYWTIIHTPCSHLTIFQESRIHKCYYDFYGYGRSFKLSVYYVFLQLFVLFLYMLLAYVLEKPIIKEMCLRLSNSMISEKVRRNKYAIGVAALSIFLLYMMIQIFVFHKYLIG